MYKLKSHTLSQPRLGKTLYFGSETPWGCRDDLLRWPVSLKYNIFALHCRKISTTKLCHLRWSCQWTHFTFLLSQTKTAPLRARLWSLISTHCGTQMCKPGLWLFTYRVLPSSHYVHKVRVMVPSDGGRNCWSLWQPLASTAVAVP